MSSSSKKNAPTASASAKASGSGSGGTYCCVVGCHRNSQADQGKVSFFSFPKKNQEQRQKWVNAVHRVNPDGSQWKPGPYAKICSDHFVSGRWSPTRNDPDYAPTQFPTKHVKAKSDQDVARYARLQSRSLAQSMTRIDNCESGGEEELTPSNSQASQTASDLQLAKASFRVTFESFESEIIVSPEQKICNKSTQISSTISYAHDAGVQVHFGQEELASLGGFDVVAMTERQFKAFTGIQKNLFHFILDLAEDDIKSSRIIERDGKLALFLVKLKLNPTFAALSGMFQLRREEAASQCFSEVLSAMVKIAKTGVIWFSKDKIQARLPPSFKALYPETRVIIDCSEIPCEKPHLLKQRTLLYSNYKSRHTLKFLVGCAPSGEIMFISETYGGRTTDTEATIKSGLMTLIENGDAVLADKGFPHIEGGVNTKGGVLVMPPFKDKQRQFSTQDNKSAYDCASVRVHIERCIARMKVFNCLHFVRLDEFKFIDDILYVISYLCNMGNDLIKQD